MPARVASRHVQGWQTGSVAGSDILDDLKSRGLVQDSTDPGELRARLDEAPITLYAGFDPTAESLHVGNLVPLLLLRRFQEAGHRVIALAGGATGMIGDPGGRSEERNLLDDATLDRHLIGVKQQLARLLDFERAANPAELVDNRDWTGPLSAIEFLRDVGKHITVNQMLAKESVRARVQSESGISFTEFSYMLLQANDFRWLFENRSCELQVGGSDQWGNITAGIDLIRRALHRQAHGLTVPLITRSDGVKFGKSHGGAIWLDASLTGPDAFYQWFINVPDADARRFLLQLTLLPVPEIDSLCEQHERAPERRIAQRALARWITELIHGSDAASRAEKAASSFTADAAGLSTQDIEALVDTIPTVRVAFDVAVQGVDLVDLLHQVAMVKSKGEARRLLDQAGIYVNDEPQSQTRTIGQNDLLHGHYLLLRKGKRQRCLVVFS